MYKLFHLLYFSTSEGIGGGHLGPGRAEFRGGGTSEGGTAETRR